MANDQATYTTRQGAFTVRGHELTGLGDELRVGDLAPDAELAGRGFVPAPVRISDYRGKVLILSCVPSLDTPTCDRETRRWEEERWAATSRCSRSAWTWGSRRPAGAARRT